MVELKSKPSPDWRVQDRLKSRKVQRPSYEELKSLTKTLPMTKIGKMFDVSDNAVRKWIKRYELGRGATGSAGHSDCQG